MRKALTVAGIAGLISYAISFTYFFISLLMRQPPHTPDGVWPQEVTSAPPSLAFYTAIPIGMVTFVGAFICTLVIADIRSRASKKAS
jgi:hypothetical protein